MAMVFVDVTSDTGQTSKVAVNAEHIVTMTKVSDTATEIHLVDGSRIQADHNVDALIKAFSFRVDTIGAQPSFSTGRI